jgi:hypothetical protein
MAYLWNTGDTPKQLSITQSGFYTLMATDICATQYDSLSLVNQDSLTIDLGIDHKLCAGKTLDLAAPNGFQSYLWNTGATTSSLQVANAGLYWLSAIGICGEKRDSIVLTAVPTPLAPLVSDTVYCRLSAALPLSAQGQNLLWYATQSSNVASTIAPIPSTQTIDIQYFFVSQSQNGCESDKAEMEVEIKDKPIFPALTVKDICPEDVLTIRVSPKSMTNYTWATHETSSFIRSEK